MLGTTYHTACADITLTSNSKHLYPIHSVAIKQVNERNFSLNPIFSRIRDLYSLIYGE